MHWVVLRKAYVAQPCSKYALLTGVSRVFLDLGAFLTGGVKVERLLLTASHHLRCLKFGAHRPQSGLRLSLDDSDDEHDLVEEGRHQGNFFGYGCSAAVMLSSAVSTCEHAEVGGGSNAISNCVVTLLKKECIYNAACC